jgi:hypothetical protein
MHQNAVLKNLAMAGNTGNVPQLLEVLQAMKDWALDPEHLNLTQDEFNRRCLKACLKSCSRKMEIDFPDIIELRSDLSLAVQYGFDQDEADEIIKKAERRHDLGELFLPPAHVAA